MSKGNYVSDETVGKVDGELRPEEEVQYIARGNKVEQSYRGSTESIDFLKGRPWLVATDQRVVLKIPKIMSSRIESFEYDELAGADLGNSGMTGTRVKFRTIQGKDYSFRADKPDDTELEMMTEFMRERVDGQQAPESDTGTTTTASSSSNRADLHKTESCIECGEGVSADVSRCPHCGYDPSDHKTWLYIHVLLSGTIVLLPISFFKARAHAKKARKGVTG